MDILMSKLTVVKMPDHPLTDIPNVLRRIADEIEAGSYGEIEMAGVVMENDSGDIETFGAGKTDFYRGYTLFAKAMKAMLEL